LDFEATAEYCGTILSYFYFLSSELYSNIISVLGVPVSVTSQFILSEKTEIKNIFIGFSL